MPDASKASSSSRDMSKMLTSAHPWTLFGEAKLKGLHSVSLGPPDLQGRCASSPVNCRGVCQANINVPEILTEDGNEKKEGNRVFDFGWCFLLVFAGTAVLRINP